MQKFFSIFLATCLTFLIVAPSVDASVRIRKGRLNQTNTTYTPRYQPYQQPYQQYYQPQAVAYQAPQVYPTSGGSTYYYSQNYVQGYTYYSTPTPGYYYYFATNTVTNYTTTTVPYNNPNMICTIINGRYQCVANSYGYNYATYPGCSSPDIIIGSQIWASCNALDRNEGSTSKTGWFFAGDRESSFTSYDGANTTLEWMGKQTRESSRIVGPCATGYRLPTRGEWETLQSYARAGNTSVASLISLGQNGSYQGSRNTNGDITITGRLAATAAYWSSSVDGGVPIVMHVGSTYQGYNTTGTDYGYVNNGYQWTYGDTGLSLLRSTTGELANVRCIKQ